MKTILLKFKLLIGCIFICTSMLNAQIFDFPDAASATGWNGNLNTASITWDGDALNGWGAGDGGLILTRSGTFGGVEVAQLIDGSVKNYLKIRLKNTTNANKLRFLVSESIKSSWATFDIDANMTDFQTYYFDLADPNLNWAVPGSGADPNPTNWGEVDEDIVIYIQGNYVMGEGNVFIDEVSFLTFGTSFNNYVQNPSFEDLPTSFSGWKTPGNRTFADFSVSQDEAADGSQSFKIKFNANQPATNGNLFIENTNTGGPYAPKFPIGTELRASMKVQIKRIGAGAGLAKPVKIQGNFRVIDGATAQNRVDNEETSGALDAWEELFFEGVTTQSAENVIWRFNVQPNTYLQYDEIYIDDVKACIDCTTLGTENIVKDDSSLKLFPNPVRDVLNVSVAGRSIDKIEVYSVLGKRVLSAEKTESINVSNLSPGIYISKIYGDNDSISTKRFIKQ